MCPVRGPYIFNKNRIYNYKNQTILEGIRLFPVKTVFEEKTGYMQALK